MTRTGLAATLLPAWLLIGAQAGTPVTQSSTSGSPEVGFVPLLNVTDSSSWMSEKRLEGMVSVTADGLRLDGPSGWLATRQSFSDFALKFSLRLPKEPTDAGVFIRFNPVSDRSDRRFYGYEISVRRQTGRSDKPMARIVGHGTKLKHVAIGQNATSAPSESADGWHRYEVECIDSSMTVTENGRLIAAAGRLSVWAGSVAFEVRQGALEIRDVLVKDLLAPDDEGAGNETVYRVGEDGSVKPPRLLRDVKPRYTRRAMEAKITGEVTLECVVLSSGVVGRVRIVKSLDPVHGLDQEAVRAARQWRFEPGTKNGQPVAVLVQIVLTFRLRL